VQDSENPWPEAILIVESVNSAPRFSNSLRDQVFGIDILSRQA